MSEKLRALRRESRVEVARDLKSAVERAEMLIVAVRPASVIEMLDEVAGCGVAPPRLCISLAAGIPLRNLRERLGAVDSLGARHAEPGVPHRKRADAGKLRWERYQS